MFFLWQIHVKHYISGGLSGKERIRKDVLLVYEKMEIFLPLKYKETNEIELWGSSYNS